MQKQDNTNSYLQWLTSTEKLGNFPKISYSEMAKVALNSGQKNLALKILDHEFDDSLKVEKLLEWSENTAAFIKALESGNPDLIYMVILKLCENMPFEDFKTTIRNFPIAISLYKKYCTQYDLENLQEILSQENDHKGQACTFIKEAIDKNKSHMRDSLLTSAASAFKKARQNFHSQLCEEQLKLLEFQKQINIENSDITYIGRSVNETCLLLLKNERKMAEDFRNEFKIPDRRFYWLKIRTLAELGEWTKLQRVSRMKKCPLGYEKFIDVCLERNNKEEAMKYLEKVGEKFKMKYYIKMGCFEEAVQIASKRRDRHCLLAAFIKVVESGNPDLIYMVMLKLCENMPFEDFKTTISNFPIAVTLYKKYCTQYDLENLHEILSQENDHKGQACTFIKEAIDKNKSHMRDSLLTSAASAFKKARQNVHSQLCEEQLKLLEFQKQINNENSDVTYIGRTVNETCLLLLKNERKMAEDFRIEFKIPNRRFCWLKIRTLAELGEWTELQKVSRMKKCPLGYEKFIDVCLERNNKEEAMKYLEKVGEKFKMKYYIKMGCFEEAVQIAVKRRDRHCLLVVRSQLKSKSELAKKVDSLVSSLDTATYQIWHSFTT